MINLLADSNFGPAQAVTYMIGNSGSDIAVIWLLVWVSTAQRKNSQKRSAITSID